MVLPLLSLLLLLQQEPAPPQVISSLDRDRVTMGEEVVLTVQVISGSVEPIEIALPPLLGLEIVSRSQRTEVSSAGGPARTTTLEVRLRALQEGHLRLGPFQVRQGPHVVQADEVGLTVEAGGPAVAVSLNPRVARLLERAPPPRIPGPAAITVMLSADSALVGEQVDVLTIAWFRREVRLQLRRPPTVEAPKLDGVWSYPQPVPGGIAASRLVDGRWYDLFLIHQIVFPLAVGSVTVTPARLNYSIPVAFQFFSQEDRYALESAPRRLTIDPLPDAGRPAGFGGAVAHGLKLDRTVTPDAGHPGEPLTVEVTLTGEGNVALWPVPALRWPAHVRTYADATQERLAPQAGRLGGTKIFRFILVPDSAGSAYFPSIAYPYFDPVLGSYQLATTDGASVPVAPVGEGPGSRALPPPLVLSRHSALAWQLLHAPPPWFVVLILLLAPLLPFVPRLRRPAPVGAPPGTEPDTLQQVERRLDALLSGLSPVAGLADGAHRFAALEAAGLDASEAARLLALRGELRCVRFAPHSAEDVAELCREVDRLAGQLAPRDALRPRRMVVLSLALLLLVRPATAQSPSAEQLYEAGAFAAAADAFAKRTRAEPEVYAHWYNLGAASFRLGQDARALAAWVHAARLAPRNRSLDRALLLVPPGDQVSARWLWVAPTTPDELWLLGAVCWLVGWVGVMLSQRLRGRWVVLLVAALLSGAAGSALHAWYLRPIGLVTSRTDLLLSPHQRAPKVAPVDAATAVRIEQGRAAWFLVEDVDGHRGWVEKSRVERLAD